MMREENETDTKMAALAAAETLRFDAITARWHFQGPAKAPGVRPDHHGAKWPAPFALIAGPASIKSVTRAFSRRGKCAGI
jgi:hypothetical protein